jgi:hypothetical protein
MVSTGVERSLDNCQRWSQSISVGVTKPSEEEIVNKSLKDSSAKHQK